MVPADARTHRSPSLTEWPPSVAVCRALRCIPPGVGGSCDSLLELTHPYQVVRCHGEGKMSADSPHATELDLLHEAHRLQPAEDLFDPLPLLLTDSVAKVSRRPTVNGTGPSRRVLGHMRRHLEPR